MPYPRARLDQTGNPYRSPLTGKFVDEVDYDTHVSDVRHIQATIEKLQNPDPCGDTECSYPDCDCNNSETIMLSSGYAEVYQDGDVIQYGRTIWKEE